MQKQRKFTCLVILGILSKFFQHMSARVGSYIQIVGKSCAVSSRAWEWMLLAGLLCREKFQHK